MRSSFSFVVAMFICVQFEIYKYEHRLDLTPGASLVSSTKPGCTYHIYQNMTELFVLIIFPKFCIHIQVNINITGELKNIG